MNAIHILWTRPFLQRNPGTEFFIDDFELLTTILSALKWREQNGTIQMVTDSRGADYYHRLGLDKLWDSLLIGLDEIPAELNADIFWAAGKLFALQQQKSPCVLLDTDFIVWRPILFENIHVPAAVIHREELYPDVYPGPEQLHMKPGYSFDPRWDWSQLPCNTAFAYFNDQELLDDYTAASIDFMENALNPDNFLTYMVFAEQRLLAMCAKAAGKDIMEFSTLERLFRHGEDYFTHTWGFKAQMRQEPFLREAFCKKAAQRVCTDFPAMRPVLQGIPELAQYL